MTEREPDPLFDALHKRLAEHGQEPPAHLWAGIRQQLPPPVAVPQRRRWRAGLLLALLLLVSVGGWQLWRSGVAPRQTAPVVAGAETATPATKGMSASSVIENERSAPAKSWPEVDLAIADDPTLAAAERKATTSAAVADAADPAAPAATATTDNNASPARAAKAGSAKASPARPARVAALAAAEAEPQPGKVKRRHEARAGIAAAVSLKATRATRAEAPGAATAGAAALAAADAARSRPSAVAATAAGASARPAGSAAGAAGGTVAASKSIAPAAPAGSGREAAGQPAGRGRPQAAPAAALAGVNAPATTDENQRNNPAIAKLALRAIDLPAKQPWGVPGAPEPLTVERSKPVLSPPARWAVQVLAGPALTYRHLGTAPQPAGNVPVLASANSIAELERPAVSGGALVSLRRYLGAHWSVSAGLGYTDYATRLALRRISVPAASVANLDPSTFVHLADSFSTPIHLRDSYRMLTVPLRVGYSWQPRGRWRLGMQAGADAALYLGGRSTEGSGCACQQQTWTSSNSPYRRVSLGASLGLEARYRLSDQWELLAQPTATYFLTPLAPPTVGYAPRHLLGGAALLGISYELR